MDGPGACRTRGSQGGGGGAAGGGGLSQSWELPRQQCGDAAYRVFGSSDAGIVRRLAEAGASVNSPSSFTALARAADRGDVAVMEVLAELGADVASADCTGITAMHWAATGEVVRWLASRGVSVQSDRGDDERRLPARSGRCRPRLDRAGRGRQLPEQHWLVASPLCHVDFHRERARGCGGDPDAPGGGGGR